MPSTYLIAASFLGRENNLRKSVIMSKESRNQVLEESELVSMSWSKLFSLKLKAIVGTLFFVIG